MNFSKSNSDKILFGVCSGLAKSLGVSATLIRIIFIIFGLVGLYVLLIFIMPNDQYLN